LKPAAHTLVFRFLKFSLYLPLLHLLFSYPAKDNDEALTLRQHLVQEIMLQLVFMGEDCKILRKHGFDPSEEGYLQLQLTLSEHQHDPRIADMNKEAMIRIFEAAGLTTDET
jgi:hypothetical protein